MTASISGYRPPPMSSYASTIAQVPQNKDRPKGTGNTGNTGITPSSVMPGVKPALTGNEKYEAKNVNQAFNQIKTAFKDTVYKSELEQAAKNINALSPKERSSLVNVLANTPQEKTTLLKKFLGEVISSGPFDLDGLQTNDRLALFKNLIPGQSGKNLERIFESIGKSGRASISPEQSEFSGLVAKNATATQRIDLTTRFGDNAARSKSNSAARFIAEQVGSLTNPADFKIALSKMDRPAWDRIVGSSLDVKLLPQYANSQGISTPPQFRYDTSTYENLANSVAKSGDVKFKSNFIAASGELLQKNFDSPKPVVNSITAGMTKVIRTDTNGVMAGTLALSGYSQKTDKTGREIGQYSVDGTKALRVYNKAIMNTSEASNIRIFLAQLQSGNDLQQNAFTRIGSDERAARVLGKYTGTVVSAINSQSSEENRANSTNFIFGSTAIDLAKEVVGLNKIASVFLKGVSALGRVQINKQSLKDSNGSTDRIINIAKPQGEKGEELPPNILTIIGTGISDTRESSK